MHELTRNQVFTVLLYKILLVIEALQFIWYAIHPRFSFLWKSDIIDGIRDAMKFCQVRKLNNFFSKWLFYAFLRSKSLTLCSLRW